MFGLKIKFTNNSSKNEQYWSFFVPKSMNALVCIRRDLRLEDNAALYYALRNNKNVKVIFIFDENILQYLENKEILCR